MMKQLQQYLNQLVTLITDFRTGNRQLFNLIAGTVGIAVVFGAALYVINPGAPVVLVANLSPADRTALALRLRRHDIKFTLGADSITVGSRDAPRRAPCCNRAPAFPAAPRISPCSIAPPWGRATSMSR